MSFISFAIASTSRSFVKKLFMSGEKNDNNLKNEIKKALETFFDALSRKNIKDMMSIYASEAVIFDVKPPFQVKGSIAWKHIWEACLPFFPENFKVEVKELTIHVDGNTGFAHYFFKLTGPDKDHPAMQTWMRATTGYKLQSGKWKVVHEHGSLPYNPMDNQVTFSKEI